MSRGGICLLQGVYFVYPSVARKTDFLFQTTAGIKVWTKMSKTGSPVALNYYDRAPFRFNGKIHRIYIRYTGKQGRGFRASPDDD